MSSIDELRERMRELLEELADKQSALNERVSSLEEEIVLLRKKVDTQNANPPQPDPSALEDIERLTDRCANVEQRLTELATLFATVHRLHTCLEVEQVLVAIEEIVVSFLGSEHMAVFGLDPATSTLRLMRSMGVDPDRYRTIPVGTGTIGQVARTGQPHYATDRADDRVEVCIPLTMEGTVKGVLAIFRFLPHKGDLQSVDRDLLDLLSTHAAIALYTARVRRGG